MKMLKRHSAILPAILLIAIKCSAIAGTTQPATPPVKVSPLPDGWVAKTPIVKAAKQYAANAENNIFFELIEEPVSDFSDDLDLTGYGKLIQQTSAAKSKLGHRVATDLKPSKVGGRDVIEYEVTGELQGLKLHYRFVLVRIGDTYCNLSCWCTPSHWADAQADIESLVGNLTETKNAPKY